MSHNGILFKDGRFTGRFDEMYEREEECGYDSWDQSDFTYQKQIDLVLANSVMKDDCRVLDLGCGKGLFSSMLKGKAAMVRGIDISGNTILRASAQYHDIEFVVGDIVIKDERGGWDLIIARALLYYIPEWKVILERIAQSTKYALIGNHIPENTILYISSKDEFMDELKRHGLQVVEIVEYPLRSSFSVLCKSNLH